MPESGREALTKTLLAADRPEASSEAFLAYGEVLSGTYEIRTLLGSGGMGQVYEALDRVLGRRVAIKIGQPGSDPALLIKEAQVLAAIRHLGVVTVHGVGVHDGAPFVVMELLHGISLAAWLEKRCVGGELPSLEEVFEILSPLAEALAAVHRAGISHRDVKPDNVMLAPGGRVVLMDFGIFSTEREASESQASSGTPGYMAPETIASSLSLGDAYLVDVYAFGVLAYQTLTGRAPFEGRSVAQLLTQHLASEPPSVRKMRRGAPAPLAALVAEMLAKEPHDRPQSMESVALRLRALRATRGEAARDKRFAILIVDDDRELVRLLDVLTRRAVPGATVEAVFDGEAALRRLTHAPPDLLLLDLQMPGMNGIELLMYLRGTQLADSCAIIAISGGAGTPDIDLFHQLGVVAFERKGMGLADRLVPQIREAHRRTGH